MADRASKRLRRTGDEYDSEGVDDWTPVQDKASSGHLTSSAPTASSTRPRRGTAGQQQAPAATIQRSSPEETRPSIHLTVKASPNKLRKATSGSVAKTSVSSRNIVQGKRASRNSRVVKEVDSDDEDEEEDVDDEVEEEDAMDVDDDDDEEEDEDAEGEEDEDMDAEGEEDEDMDDLTPAPAPRIVVSSNENIRVKPTAIKPPVQDSVEAKEIAMEDDDDDDELSELDSDEDLDAEGEDDDAEGEEDDELGAGNDDDDDLDSDDGTPASMSRSHTPDLSKMTRRQRAMVVEDSDGSLMALSNEAQKKKHLTAEEHAMRRAEMARRRKNLSEKRNEEEKMDTINRLLKKQPPKRQRRVIQDLADSGQEDEPEVEKAPPLYVRYIQDAKGTSLAVPEEWLQSPAGSLFTGKLAPASNRPFGGRMVEEVS